MATIRYRGEIFTLVRICQASVVERIGQPCIQAIAWS